jgi:hypothetical protein
VYRPFHTVPSVIRPPRLLVLQPCISDGSPSLVLTSLPGLMQTSTHPKKHVFGERMAQPELYTFEHKGVHPTPQNHTLVMPSFPGRALRYNASQGMPGPCMPKTRTPCGFASSCQSPSCATIAKWSRLSCPSDTREVTKHPSHVETGQMQSSSLPVLEALVPAVVSLTSLPSWGNQTSVH